MVVVNKISKYRQLMVKFITTAGIITECNVYFKNVSSFLSACSSPLSTLLLSSPQYIIFYIEPMPSDIIPERNVSFCKFYVVIINYILLLRMTGGDEFSIYPLSVF